MSPSTPTAIAPAATHPSRATATTATPDWRRHSAALGVTASSLSAAQRSSLDRDGYVILEGLSDATWLARARDRYEELVRIEGADLFSRHQHAGSEMHRELGCRRLPDLVNKGEVWDQCWQEPRILAVVAHVLERAFHLSALSGRDAQQGFGHQGLHADWGPRVPSEPFHVVNCIWALDGFTLTNGGPRLVPGSHRLAGHVGDELADPTAAHPRQIIAEVPPGAVLAMNSHTWHGGSANRDGTPRRTIHAYFSGREHLQQLNQAEYLRVRTASRLSPAARWILDG